MVPTAGHGRGGPRGVRRLGPARWGLRRKPNAKPKAKPKPKPNPKIQTPTAATKKRKYPSPPVVGGWWLDEAGWTGTTQTPPRPLPPTDCAASGALPVFQVYAPNRQFSKRDPDEVAFFVFHGVQAAERGGGARRGAQGGQRVPRRRRVSRQATATKVKGRSLTRYQGIRSCTRTCRTRR